MGDLGAVLHAVEQACVDFQIPEKRQQAEATLLELRSSPHSLAACQYIMQHSSSHSAQFHAAIALREAALRQWPALSNEQQFGLQRYLLQYIMQHIDGGQAVVLSQCCHTLAAMIKRSWMDTTTEQKNAFFQEMQQVAAQRSSAASRQASLLILESVVSEFSPDTASAMGMSWEYHDKCKLSLQSDYLPSFYRHALSTAQEYAAPSSGGVGAWHEGVLAAACSCMCTILGWDFRGARPGAGWGMQQYRGGMDTLQVKPGPEWRDLLLSADSTAWLRGLLTQLKASSQSDSRLAQTARQLVVMLCGLAGDVFPKESAEQRGALGLNPMTPREEHLSRMLAILLPWITPPHAAVQRALHHNPEELLDACRAISLLAPTHRAAGVALASSQLNREGLQEDVLDIIAALTCELVKAYYGEGKDDEAVQQATEYMLEAWVELLEPLSSLGCRDALPASAQSAAHAVFQTLTQEGMKDAAAGAYEDADESEESGGGAAAVEEWMTRMAAVGRVCTAPTLHLILNNVLQVQQALAAAAQAGADTSMQLEQLCWLIRLSGYVVADSGEGETPLLPVVIEQLSDESSRSGTPDPTVMLCQSTLCVVSSCTEQQARSISSPRLMECLMWWCGRWVDTYLCPDDSLPQTLKAAFGEGQLTSILQLLVNAALTCLVAYPGEVELHKVVCCKLLSSLVRRPAVCKQVVQMEQWNQLAGAFSEQAPGIRALSPQLQRVLCTNLSIAAVGVTAHDGARNTVEQLLRGVTGDLVALGNRADLQRVCDQPDTIYRVICMMECMRGAAAGVVPRTQPILLCCFQGIMTPLLQLQHAYRHSPQVTAVLFKLAAETVSAHVTHLQSSDASSLCSWILTLLQQYSAVHKGEVVLAVKALKEEEQMDKYRELRALLKLLTQLTTRDLVDLSEQQQNRGPAVDVAQVVLLGLDILIPLMSVDLLSYPALCHDYFTLMAYIAEVYTHKLVALPVPLFRSLMTTLDFGLNHMDTTVLQQSLEALAAIARYHYTAVRSGAPGLGQHNVPGPDGRTFLGHMLELCLRRLVYDNCQSVMEALGEAILPLILSEPATFHALGEQLLCSAVDASHRGLLHQSLHQLTAGNGVTQSLDKHNRRRFRGNLQKFANEVRSVIRVR